MKYKDENEFFEEFYYNLKTDEYFRKQYNYLLGLYLGDGHIIFNKLEHKPCYKLTIYNNSDQNKVIHETNIAIRTIFSDNKINNYKQLKANVVECQTNNKYLPIVFPQHGKHHKHERDVRLLGWQVENIEYEYLLKGLFHSDGSFYNTRGYYMYNFTNCSVDIQNIFKYCLENLGIRYTFSNKVVESHCSKAYITKIYRGKEVFKLYKIIGEKYFESRCNFGNDIKHK